MDEDVDRGVPGTVDDISMIRRTQNKAEGAPPVPCRPHHTLPRRRRDDVSCDQGRGPAPRTSVDAQKQDFGRTASLTNLCLECDSTSLFVLNAEPGEGNIVSILYSPGAPHWRVVLVFALWQPMDVGVRNGEKTCLNVQQSPAEVRRVRGRFSFARCKGLPPSRFFVYFPALFCGV